MMYTQTLEKEVPEMVAPEKTAPEKAVSKKMVPTKKRVHGLTSSFGTGKAGKATSQKTIPKVKKRARNIDELLARLAKEDRARVCSSAVNE